MKEIKFNEVGKCQLYEYTYHFCDDLRRTFYLQALRKPRSGLLNASPTVYGMMQGQQNVVRKTENGWTEED